MAEETVECFERGFLLRGIRNNFRTDETAEMTFTLSFYAMLATNVSSDFEIIRQN